MGDLKFRTPDEVVLTMFKNLQFFSKHDAPQEEVRRLPSYWADFELILPGSKRWICSQVFIDKKDSSRRFYFGGLSNERHNGSYEWLIREFEWYAKSSSVLTGKKDMPSFCRLADTINYIKMLEAEAAKSHTPIHNLPGNYREVAAANGHHFDADGNCIAIDSKKPIAVNATFNRKALDTLYAPDKNLPKMTSWDDFYRMVVDCNYYPRLPETEHQSIAAKMAEDQLRERCRKVLEQMAGVVMELRRRQSPKELHLLLARFAPDREEDAYERYHGNVLVLTKLLREGAHLYQEFAASSAREISTDGLSVLSDIAGKIKMLCERLGLTESRAQQIEALIMQGPDPHVEKAVPFETRYCRLLARPHQYERFSFRGYSP